MWTDMALRADELKGRGAKGTHHPRRKVRVTDRVLKFAALVTTSRLNQVAGAAASANNTQGGHGAWSMRQSSRSASSSRIVSVSSTADCMSHIGQSQRL